MASSVTVRDIAQGAAVSVATVSRVLNNHTNVKEEVRQRVFKAAKELGYFSSQPAEARIAAKPLKELIFLYGSTFDSASAITNPFWSQILQGVEHEGSKSGIKITYRSLSELNTTPELLATALKDMSSGGILLVGPAEPLAIQAIRETRIPFVLIDNYIPKASLDAVLSDNFEGARQAVEHLIEQGHQKIAFIGGPTLQANRPVNKIYTIERRASGYRTAMLDAGLEVDYNLYESSNLGADGGYQACRRLLERRADFTALFCANDASALGAMKALREAGLSIPEDISVVGFDDIEMAEHYHPALTTVRVNKVAMGAAAVKALISRVADPEAVSATITLEVELIERASVTRVKNT